MALANSLMLASRVGDREPAKLVAFMGLGFWRVWRGTDHRKEAREWDILKHSHSLYPWQILGSGTHTPPN